MIKFFLRRRIRVGLLVDDTMIETFVEEICCEELEPGSPPPSEDVVEACHRCMVDMVGRPVGKEVLRQLGEAGVRSLADIALRGRDAGDVMKRLALTIAEAAIEASFMGGGPLAAIMGTANSGGLLGGLLKVGSGKAAGGPVMPGTIYPVNEKSTAPGLFIPLMPGRIEPSANDNGGARANNMTLTVRLANELLDAHFEQIAGDISVQVVQAHGPAIVEAASAQTARRLTRMRI